MLESVPLAHISLTACIAWVVPTLWDIFQCFVFSLFQRWLQIVIRLNNQTCFDNKVSNTPLDFAFLTVLQKYEFTWSTSFWNRIGVLIPFWREPFSAKCSSNCFHGTKCTSTWYFQKAIAVTDLLCHPIMYNFNNAFNQFANYNFRENLELNANCQE